MADNQQTDTSSDNKIDPNITSVSGDFIQGDAIHGDQIKIDQVTKGMLTINSIDDYYSSSPPNEDMWQGDGIEIHLDRQLMDDYGNEVADQDDYQIGISFGSDLDQIHAYRWLPTSDAGMVEVEGSVYAIEGGYIASIILPWYLFDLDESKIKSGLTFGFNVSINDSDNAGSFQETIISAAPQRTTYNNPTEWGTLLLK